MEKTTKNPQKVAVAMYLVFKFASIAALPEAHQISDSMTVAVQTPPESTPVTLDGVCYIFSCLLFARNLRAEAGPEQCNCGAESKRRAEATKGIGPHWLDWRLCRSCLTCGSRAASKKE